MNIGPFDEYTQPTRQVLRDTIKAKEIPPYDPKGGWEGNRKREKIAREKAFASQEQEVVDKRFKLQELADMIATYKQQTEDGAEAIRDYAKKHDLDSMLDFCPWDNYSIDPILESDPISSALKWMHSDHSC